MADDDVLAAGIHQHVGGDFAGVSTGGVGIAVLCADAHTGLTHGTDGSGDAHGGDAQSDIAPAASGHDGLQLSHELLGLGGGFIHLPVTGNDGLTVLSVHSIFSSIYVSFKMIRINNVTVLLFPGEGGLPRGV